MDWVRPTDEVLAKTMLAAEPSAKIIEGLTELPEKLCS
jgi:hypothetical protein